MKKPNLNYGRQRIKDIGLTDEQNDINVYLPNQDCIKKIDRLYSTPDGLCISFLTLEKKDGEYCHAITEQGQLYEIKRLADPSGKMKYDNPANTKTLPYFPINLIDAFDEGKEIQTLIITEGAIKAECASLHGLMVVGIGGIWQFRPKGSPDARTDEEKRLLLDILCIIEKCKVKNLVYLHDADALDLSKSGLLNPYADLTDRPTDFMNSVWQFKKASELIPKEIKPNCYYAHLKNDIESEMYRLEGHKLSDKMLELLTAKDEVIKNTILDYSENQYRTITKEKAQSIVDGFKHIANFTGIQTHPNTKPVKINKAIVKSIKMRIAGTKGLDDALIAVPSKREEIVEHLQKVRLKSPYFVVKKLSTLKRSDLENYFGLDTAKNFYRIHEKQIENRKHTIFNNEFYFKRGRYRYDDNKEKLVCIVPDEVSDYIKVGNDYYKLAHSQSSKGFEETKRLNFNVTTVMDDITRRIYESEGVIPTKDRLNLLKIQIARYDDFVNEPEFVSYKRDIQVKNTKLYNYAYPLPYIPEQGEFPHIENFMRHISDNKGDNKYDLVMDMIQMYYMKPKQKQRILALISKENETGKSLFCGFLRMFFGQNMSILGNTDLESQFNNWVQKSLVAFEEAQTANPTVIAMLKSLITNENARQNEKGVAVTDVNTYVKVIMNTNKVNDFVNIDEEENKWVILEVSKPPKKDRELIDKMEREIPAFMYHLLHRKLVHYTNESRFAIPDDVAETAALRNIKLNSKTPLYGLIKNYVMDTMTEFDLNELKIDTKRLFQNIFPDSSRKFERMDVKNCINKEFGLDATKMARLNIPTWNQERLGMVYIEAEKHDTEPVFGQENIVIVDQNGEPIKDYPKKDFIDIESATARCYRFTRDMFE